jgi:hypothetical protein
MTVQKGAAAAHARRLTTYLVAGVGAFSATNDAQAAIVYTPGPLVANNSTIDIDFDGVGGAEFQITHASGTTVKGPKSSTKSFNRLNITAAGGATGQLAAGMVKPARLGSGVNLSSAGPFSGLGGPLPGNLAGTFGGSWSGGQTGFIGVSFDLGGGLRYGWIQLQTPAGGLGLNTGEVLGYAYETTGASILTGDTGNISSVPEPNTMLLLASGALGVLALKRRKQP